MELEFGKLEFFVNTKLEHNTLFFFFYGTRAYQARAPCNIELKFGKLKSFILFFSDNQQINININIKLSEFFSFEHTNICFVYLNRNIVKYRNFNFKMLIFRPHLPLHCLQNK